MRIGDVLEQLHDAVPVVETYGSDECRRAMDSFRALLADSGHTWRSTMDVINFQQKKEAAIDAMDFPQAAAMRDLEATARAKAAADLTVSPDDVVDQAHALIDAARASLKG